jgi:hypothetical protein
MSQTIPAFWLALALSASICSTAATAQPATPTANECPGVAGWIERVGIADQIVEAKLDTGAETSSLGVTAIERIERDGRTWIRFMPAIRAAPRSPNRTGSAAIEARLLREVRIKRAGAPSELRPVVQLSICLAGQMQTAEFTLTDRKGLDYPALIGRRALIGRFAVDPSRTHLTEPACAR